MRKSYTKSEQAGRGGKRGARGLVGAFDGGMGRTARPSGADHPLSGGMG